MNFTRILFLLLVYSSFSQGLAQQYNFRNYTVRDGVAQSQVYALLQDHRGYLWMGTRGGGLSCFDGSSFKTYSEKDGLGNSYVHKIRQDNQRKIWIATNEGISVYDGKHFRNYSISGFNAPVPVYDIAFDSNGNQWLATGAGVFRFHKGTFTDITGPLHLSHITVNSLVIDQKQRVWFGTGKGLYRIDGKNGQLVLKTLKNESRYMGNAINVVREDPQGNIWIGTYGDGAYRYDGYHFSRIDRHHELYTRTVLDIFCDDKQHIWFATLNHGIVQYNTQTKKFSQFTENEGLSNNHVRSIIQDNCGNMWFGTSGGGVSHYFGKQFTTFDKSSGLGGNYIYSIFRDSRKRLWIGTSQKGLTVMEHSRFTNYDAQNGFIDVKVKAIAEGDDSWLYFGTEGQGLYCYDGTQFRSIPQLEDLYVKAFSKDRNGNIWIASAGSGIVRITPNGTLQPEITKYLTGSGLLQNRITCLYTDPENRIWYGTENSGIGVIRNGKPISLHLNIRNGLPSNAIRSLTGDKSGTLWIGTADAGIASFSLSGGKPENIRTYDHTDGLTSSNIYLLAIDRNGNLISGTETGLDYLYLNSRRKPVSVKHYGKGEGFTGIETCQNAVWMDDDGTIWFGTINGLARYNPANSVKNTHPPVLSINDVRLFYESLSQTRYRDAAGDWNTVQSLHLPYNQNHLSFDFFAINFSNPEAVRYQWKLAGFDHEWSPPSSEHSIVYSNINPGNYVFMVKSCNEDGVWNDRPERIYIYIAAPFWQRWWFIALEFLVGGILVFFLFRWQINRIRVKAKELQQRLKMEKELVELEQKTLRLQMNPHFIFNALNSIQSQIGTGKEQEARYYLAKFSRLMRQILDNSRNTTISLEEEIRTLENYLLIEQFCNGNRFDYAIETDPSLETDFIRLPPMLLQPFVENAIKHGFRFNDPEKRGSILITFREHGNMLECSVTDNGIGRKQSAELNKNSKETYHQSTALLVTQERLNLMNGDQSEATLEILDLTDEKGHATGTKVVIRIPV